MIVKLLGLHGPAIQATLVAVLRLVPVTQDHALLQNALRQLGQCARSVAFALHARTHVLLARVGHRASPIVMVHPQRQSRASGCMPADSFRTLDAPSPETEHILRGGLTPSMSAGPLIRVGQRRILRVQSRAEARYYFPVLFRAGVAPVSCLAKGEAAGAAFGFSFFGFLASRLPRC